jgi:nifR3 family TIM-barrel protein
MGTEPSDPIRIGPHALSNRVLLAPMSGVTDVPFRRAAYAHGAGLVISEMVASEHLVQERPDSLRKAEGRELAPFVIQLAGCDVRWMAEGARVAESLGADIIDINMGCPAREVTGKQAGSALMRDIDHAQRLIEAVAGAVALPVTLKMRLGWDHASLNAPELARRAEAAGVRLLTVHARTRCQFFKGTADWSLVKNVKDAVRIPVVVNGDIVDPQSAGAALAASGADAVMVGRGAYGAPWMCGRIAAYLATGRDAGAPTLHEQGEIALAHVEAMFAHDGHEHGVRKARKHIGWYLAASRRPLEVVKSWRQRLCTEDSAARVLTGLRAFFLEAPEAAA